MRTVILEHFAEIGTQPHEIPLEYRQIEVNKLNNRQLREIISIKPERLKYGENNDTFKFNLNENISAAAHKVEQLVREYENEVPIARTYPDKINLDHLIHNEVDEYKTSIKCPYCNKCMVFTKAGNVTLHEKINCNHYKGINDQWSNESCKYRHRRCMESSTLLMHCGNLRAHQKYYRMHNSIDYCVQCANRLCDDLKIQSSDLFLYVLDSVLCKNVF